MLSVNHKDSIFVYTLKRLSVNGKMKVSIKNMVCPHCINAVRNMFDKTLHIPVRSVALGMAETEQDLDEEEMQRVAAELRTLGFELIQARDIEIVEGVKHLLIEQSRKEGGPEENLSELLDGFAGLSYHAVARIFSSVEGRTLENYLLSLRIERVKELLNHDNMTLSEIAYETGFSSTAHLSSRFKSVTGMTPTQFKESGERKPLQEV